MRTLDLSVELFNQKVLNLDDADGDAAATANPAATETSPPARRGLPGCISRFLAAAGGPEGARRPWERDDNFAFEPRSRQWQYFGRAWNEIIISLRDGDLLSDAEVAHWPLHPTRSRLHPYTLPISTYPYTLARGGQLDATQVHPAQLTLLNGPLHPLPNLDAGRP